MPDKICFEFQGGVSNVVWFSNQTLAIACSFCRHKPKFWGIVGVRAMSEGRVPRSNWSTELQAMRCGRLPGRRRGARLQKVPWRHLTTCLLREFKFKVAISCHGMKLHGAQAVEHCRTIIFALLSSRSL